MKKTAAGVLNVNKVVFLTHRCVASSSTATLSSPPVLKPERKKKKASDDWKLGLLKMLDHEYKEKGQRLRRERIHKNALADVMRHALKDDMQSLLRLAEGQTRMRELNEVLPMCMLVLNKKFVEIMRKTDDINSDKALTLFLNIGNLWRSIKIQYNDNDMSMISLLLMHSLRSWKEQRKFDEKTKIVDDVFDLMWRKLSVVREISREDMRVFIGDEDYTKIEQEFGRLQKFSLRKGSMVEGSRYEEMELVEPLQRSCVKEEYRDNPFQLDNISKEEYTEMFEKHLKVESSMWIQVKNTIVDTKDIEVFGEELINEWQWRKRIGENLARLDPKDTHPLVAACLELLPRERLIDLLHFSAVSVCSQGQGLVGASQFSYELVTPIIRELGKSFKQKLGHSEENIWKNVFSTYIDFFEDSEISRKNTHREWWTKACKKENISPSYQFEMGHMDQQTRSEVSNVLFEILSNSCVFPIVMKTRETWMKALSFRSISVEEESKITEDGRHSLSKMLSIHSQLMKTFDRHPFENIIFSTETLPMTVPPRPWIDYGQGGPLYTTSVDIIRNMMDFRVVNLNKEAKERIRTRKQARPVYDALNQLGSTPWVINEQMLDVLKNVFSQSGSLSSKELLDKLEIPMRHDTFNVPEFEKEFGVGMRKEDISEERFRNYARRKAEAIKERNESNSLWCWMLYRVVLADHFRGKTLFFPHNMDFRGRVYPLSPYLSHMGDDVNRCILKFAKAQQLGEKGFDWLKLHCINLTGTMKRASIADRQAEAERMLPTMLDSARDPLGGEKWWMTSDEPWQTLAACMEIRDAMEYGSDVANFPSQLPIHQDGSCNGLQHYAALGRDNEGGAQVNLTECQVPNDVYSDVAQRVEQKRLEDEKGNGEDSAVAKKLREALPQGVPRKVIKQTVMTTVYGVTMYGAVLQIKRQLKALDIENDDAALFARYLARKTFASLNDAFTSSMALKDWFRLCAKSTSELMRTVEWVTPLGLPVIQPYCRVADRKGKLVVSPIPMKQVDAFPPNFVHSLDSTHMMLTSLNCAHRGITFAAVHDCFWTHAKSVDEMNEICRQQFVSLHSQPIVQQCSEWFKNTYLTKKLEKIMPEADFERYQDKFTAKVKPGELDIEQVKKSVYFFS